MTISDPRYGAEVITKKGKIYKFDDTHCVLSFLKTNELPAAAVKDIYLSDYCETHELLNVKGSFLLQTNNLRGPMGGNIAAFSNTDSLKKIQDHFSGVRIQWSEINK
jgi:copper chaperone NosL